MNSTHDVSDYAIVRIAERRAELIAAADARRLARHASDTTPAPGPVAPAARRRFGFLRLARRTAVAPA